MRRATIQRLSTGVVLAAIMVLALRFVAGQFQAAPSDESMFRTVKARADARVKTAKQLKREDAITCVLVGTGSPMPSARAQACTALFVGGRFLLFDCGDGAARSLEALDIPVNSLDAVFLTHYHSDHFADLGEVIDRSWIQGRRQVLPIHGPRGIAELLDGVRQAYRLEYGYRTAHHGAELMPPQFAAAEAEPFDPEPDGSPLVIYDEGGVVVKTFSVNHPPVRPAVGYRVEYRGKSVVISGDTTAADSLAAQSRDADLLCAEVMNMAVIAQVETANERLGNELNAHILRDIRSYHTDVHDLGVLAQEAGVKRLALTHLAPPVNHAALGVIFKKPVAEHFKGEIFAGDDGTTIAIPLND